jgi:hypothetical protein
MYNLLKIFKYLIHKTKKKTTVFLCEHSKDEKVDYRYGENIFKSYLTNDSSRTYNKVSKLPVKI